MDTGRDQTRTEKTESRYLIVARRQIASMKKESLKQGRQFTPVTWLEWKRGSLLYASFRHLRASLAYYYESTEHGNQPELAEQLRQVSPKGCKEKPTQRNRQKRNTSNKKIKRVTEQMLEDLSGIVEKGRTHRERIRGREALTFIRASILVGLRPCEWRMAYITKYKDTHDLSLFVHNAKQTNRRAHGLTRTVIIEDFSEEEKEIIRQQISNVVDYYGDFDGWLRKIGDAITAINKKLRVSGGQSLTMYSGRHQFCSNAKKSGLSLTEIAALMGHAVDETAAEHYGKRKHGKGRFKARACPEEVERVREVYKRPNPKMPNNPIKNTPSFG